MANSIHSSFSRVWVTPIPTNGVMPLTYVHGTTGGLAWVELLGLISGSVTGHGYTQIKDTEQNSPGGFQEYYPGRGEPLTGSMKFSYNRTKLGALWAFLPAPLDLRTPSYGNYLFDFERVDFLRIRSFGYISLGQSGDGEDDRQTIDVNFQGSSEAVLLVAANALFVPPLVASSQRAGLAPV